MESIKNLLLPREKFEEVSKGYGKEPFTFEIEKDGRVLFYFGANHSHDPNNSQYPILRYYWDKFLAITEDAERIVLVEDIVASPAADEESAIQLNAERGFIILLSYKMGIVVESPDISIEGMTEKLPDISREELLLYRFVNVADSFQRGNTAGLSFEDYIERWCKGKRSQREWDGVEVNLNALKNSYLKVMGDEFDLNDNMNKLADPNRTGTRINEISRVFSDLREVNIVSEIERYWKEGKSIFAVFGAGHLIVQRPALEKLLRG